eukprot:12712523-Alexandrium_andersonii.AAC.1
MSARPPGRSCDPLTWQPEHASILRSPGYATARRRHRRGLEVECHGCLLKCRHPWTDIRPKSR